MILCQDIIFFAVMSKHNAQDAERFAYLGLGDWDLALKCQFGTLDDTLALWGLVFNHLVLDLGVVLMHPPGHWALFSGQFKSTPPCYTGALQHRLIIPRGWSVVQGRNGFGQGFALRGCGESGQRGLFYYRKKDEGFGQRNPGALKVNVVYVG